MKRPKINITTSIPMEIHEKAKERNLAWNEALIFGIDFLIADKDEGVGLEYPQSNLKDKFDRIVKQFQAKCQECEALRDQLEGANEVKN